MLLSTAIILINMNIHFLLNLLISGIYLLKRSKVYLIFIIFLRFSSLGGFFLQLIDFQYVTHWFLIYYALLINYNFF